MNIELKYLSEVESRWHWASVDREKSSNRNLAAAAFTLPHSPGRAVAKSSSEKILDKENEVIGKENTAKILDILAPERFWFLSSSTLIIARLSLTLSPFSASSLKTSLRIRIFFSSLLIEILVQKQQSWISIFTSFHCIFVNNDRWLRIGRISHFSASLFSTP